MARDQDLPAWSWAYVTFRLADGASNALIPLAVVVHYGMPLWALALTAAAMNLAGVPAAFLWGSRVEHYPERRRLVGGGFAVTALALAVLAFLPPFPLFVAAAMAYTVFGVSTAPAASTLVLRGVQRRHWAQTTGALSRRTGFAFLTGMAISVGLGLTHRLDFSEVFTASAIVTALATFIAVRTVPAAQAPLPPHAEAEALLVQQGQRRFERAVFFPMLLSYVAKPGQVWRALKDPHRLWPLGYAFSFMGSVSFFASYPGVLANELLLPAGLVLLAQAPSHIVTPITYPWAGRVGARIGESKGVLIGSTLRLVTVPLLCGTIVFAGASALGVIMALHAVMGLSFAFIQVNGPILLAQAHPDGRGPGVGTFHAAQGAGVLMGSLTAFVLLRIYPFQYSYIASVGLGALGAFLLWQAHRRWMRTTHPGPQAPRAEAIVAEA